MTMVDEVAAFLDAQTSLTVGTDLWKSLMPDTPETAVCIYPTPGQMPRESLGGSSYVIERPNMQIVSRAPTFASAEANARACWNALRGVTDQSLSGVRYLRIQTLQSPFSLGYDENRRARVAFNIMVEKDVS